MNQEKHAAALTAVGFALQSIQTALNALGHKSQTPEVMGASYPIVQAVERIQDAVKPDA